MEPSKVHRLPCFYHGFLILIVHAILLLGTFVAFSNLSADFGAGNIFFSTLWIAGYFALWYLNVKWDGGPVVTAVRFFENFGWERFLRVDLDAEYPVLLTGYKVFGREILVLRVKTSGVREITWNPGQASCMSNTDMNDWLVFLELDTPDILLYRERRYDNDLRESFLVLSDLTREQVAAEAERLQRFLAENGIRVPIRTPADDVIERFHTRSYSPGHP